MIVEAGHRPRYKLAVPEWLATLPRPIATKVCEGRRLFLCRPFFLVVGRFFSKCRTHLVLPPPCLVFMICFPSGQVRAVIKAHAPFIDACKPDELSFDKPPDLFL